MLLNLNDDCLLQIYQMLPLRDQINLMDISKRFQYLILDYVWSKKYRDIHTQMKCFQPLSLQQYKKFFQYNKENIEKLKIEDVNNFVYVYNANRSINRPDYAYYFGLKMDNLKEFYCYDSRVHDGYMLLLSKNCPRLEVIHLKTDLVTREHISKFKYLRELKL